MKISEITNEDVRNFARLDPYEEEEPITAILRGAIQYVLSYTGLSGEQADQYEDLSIAVLVLCTDMYNNRQMTIDKGNINLTVKTILNMYAVNLL